MIDVGVLSVIRRWQLREGLPIREISRRTGLSRNTIKKYLKSGEVEPKYSPRPSQGKLLAFEEKLSVWLDTEGRKSRKQRRNLRQMYSDLVALGYRGSYDRVAAFAPAHIALGSDIPVANWLDGAATIEVSIGGTWWPLHGTTIPTATDIRIGNGLVRVTLLAKKSGLTQNVDPLWEQWSGTVWQPVQLRQADTSLLVAWRAIEGVKVLRNDPGQLECTAEKIPVAWTTAIPVTAISYTWGAVYGGRFSSAPLLAVVSDGLAAVTLTSPSNIRDGTLVPGRWGLCRLSPSETRHQWNRASTQQLRVLV